MDIVTKNVDHLGLVAGMYDEIGVGDLIDRACGDQANNKNLTFGQCVKCMILNGLGFVGRTLYLYSEYFEDKPVDHLIGTQGVTPEQIDDNVLGRTLDRLFSLGVTELFTEIALKAVQTLGIEVKSLHLDSTSFHLDREYESLLGQGESRIKITRGYSRDHRRELKQVVLQLMTAIQGNLPLFMKAASGNSSDKTDFSRIVSEHIKSFQEALDSRYFVGDSALYTPSSIIALEESSALFITRVPGQIKKESELIQKCPRDTMIELKEGYYGQELPVTYADVQQRWVVIFSQAAYERECRTLLKNFKKGSEKEFKDFKKFESEVFSCPDDAKKAFTKRISKYKYLSVREFNLREVKKYPTVGRPLKTTTPCKVGFQVLGVPYTLLKHKEEMESKKGYFVLATNDLDSQRLLMQEVLDIYKSQQIVERGFRFLKSPDFLVSAFFLKKPERIEALLMVMILCLLVYSAVEYRVRQQLRETQEFFPDQKKRPTQNPTARWIFFCFLGLHLVILDKKKSQITNLKERHRIMLRCLGPPYQKMYYCEML